VVATAGNVPGSLRSGRLIPAVPHFKRYPTEMHRSLLRLSLLVAFASGLIYLCGYALQSPVYRYDCPASNVFSEADALRFSTRALEDAGIATVTMQPVSFRHESDFDQNQVDRFFARNIYRPNDGYVMWDIRYTVHLKHNGDTIDCTVSKHK